MGTRVGFDRRLFGDGFLHHAALSERNRGFLHPLLALPTDVGALFLDYSPLVLVAVLSVATRLITRREVRLRARWKAQRGVVFAVRVVRVQDAEIVAPPRIEHVAFGIHRLLGVPDILFRPVLEPLGEFLAKHIRE